MIVSVLLSVLLTLVVFAIIWLDKAAYQFRYNVHQAYVELSDWQLLRTMCSKRLQSELIYCYNTSNTNRSHYDRQYIDVAFAMHLSVRKRVWQWLRLEARKTDDAWREVAGSPYYLRKR